MIAMTENSTLVALHSVIPKFFRIDNTRSNVRNMTMN